MAACRRLHSLWLQQDAVLRPYNLQLPNTMSELRGQSPPAPTAVPLRQLLRVPLSLPPLFLRGERHFHGCFTCSRHVGCHFAARECRSLHNSRGPPLIGCLPYASVSSGFQWGHLDTSPGASLRSFSVDPGSTLPIPTPHLKSTILASHLNLGQAARQCGPTLEMNQGRYRFMSTSIITQSSAATSVVSIVFPIWYEASTFSRPSSTESPLSSFCGDL